MPERPSYRDLYDEVATLRQENEELRAALDRWLNDDGDPLRIDADLLNFARARSCPTCFSIGVRRDNCQDLWHVDVRDVVSAPLISADEVASPQPGGKESEVRQAATRVVQLVTHGADGLVVGEAIAEMRRVLDGGGE